MPLTGRQSRPRASAAIAESAPLSSLLVQLLAMLQQVSKSRGVRFPLPVQHLLQSIFENLAIRLVEPGPDQLKTVRIEAAFQGDSQSIPFAF